jgi:hypothetical protein
MTPENVCHILRQVSSYIETNSTPDKSLIIATLANISDGLSVHTRSKHVSADPRNFTKSEFNDADVKITNFIDRLDKVVDSLNPQDPSRVDLTDKVENFKYLQTQFQTEFKDMNVSV